VTCTTPVTDRTFAKAIIVLCNLSNFPASHATFPAGIEAALEVLHATNHVDVDICLANLRGAARPMGTIPQNQEFLLIKLREALAKDWSAKAYGGYEFSVHELMTPWLCLAANVSAEWRPSLVKASGVAAWWAMRTNEPAVCETALSVLRVLNEHPPAKVLDKLAERSNNGPWRAAFDMSRVWR